MLIESSHRTETLEPSALFLVFILLQTSLSFDKAEGSTRGSRDTRKDGDELEEVGAFQADRKNHWIWE